TGMQLQDELIRRGSRLPVIMISSYPETAVTIRALRKGAFTVLDKPCGGLRLWEVIEGALNAEEASRERQERLAALRIRALCLTFRERQVMDHLVQGLANKAVSARLDLSTRTVESLRARVFQKMGMDSLADLVRVVVELKFEEELEQSRR
ncbi:MAG: LuxR C-terminal-related transcriptional regulator, partial [Planctomycetales bacterium]